MPKTVLIILAAVVALIVIVVLTGMRYLRADDEDDFDDGMPAEHGRSRSRGSHPAPSQTRARQGNADDLANDRQRDRVGAARGARPIQQRGMDQHGSSRAEQSRSRRDDGASASRGGRPAAAARDQLPTRTARRDYDDISEPIPAARPARAPGRGRGADDYDSLPGRRNSSPDYDRDPRERRNGRDRAAGYDDLSGRGDGSEPRETRDRRDRGNSRPGRDRADLGDSRPAASIRDDSDRGDRDRRSNTRPNMRSDARKNGSKPDAEVLPALKPRQGKNKRESEGDWPSNEWDELSDVDYWAELASDKPFTAPEPPEAPRSERRDARADRKASNERAARADRDARHDSRTGAEAITKQMSRPPLEPDSGILPAARHRDLSAGRPTAARTAEPRPAIGDDDPLTSPSFPRVAADDSRSYRRSRSAPPADSRYDNGRGSELSRPSNGNGRAPADQSPYPSMPPVEPVGGFDSASTTRRHALPAASSDRYNNSLPSHPSTSVPTNYQVPATSGAYQTPESSYAGPNGVNGSYSLPQPYGEPGGYQAGAGYPSGVSADYPHANGSPSGGYLPPAGDNSGFGSDTSSGSYQSPPPAPDSYRPDFGAASYQGGAGYGMRGYDPLTSPSLPPGPASYGNGAADQAGGYPGYGGQTPRSGSHRRPEPGYPDGSYQGHNGYDSGGPQPGYGASDYQASSYDHQAGYPLPPHEEDGYQGTDPYAADPYGQHGYGGNGY